MNDVFKSYISRLLLLNSENYKEELDKSYNTNRSNQQN